MSAFLLSCLTYLIAALPGSTLGLVWPSLRLSIHEPVSALGILLMAGVIAIARVATERSGPDLVTVVGRSPKRSAPAAQAAATPPSPTGSTPPDGRTPSPDWIGPPKGAAEPGKGATPAGSRA